MAKPMMQRREEWLDGLIALNKQGKLSDGALLAALKLSADIWESNPPALAGDTGSILSRVHMTKAVYYRHVRTLTTSGFLSRENSHLIVPTFPDRVIVPVKSNSLSW